MGLHDRVPDRETAWGDPSSDALLYDAMADTDSGSGPVNGYASHKVWKKT